MKVSKANNDHMTDVLAFTDSIVRIGIIGGGGITRAAHLPVLAAVDGIKLEWVCDPDVTRTKALASSYGIPRIRTAPEVMESPECDFILLAAPYGFRQPYYDALSKHNLGWYIEKPFAQSYQEHQSRIEHLSKRMIFCGYQRRAAGVLKMLKEVIADGLFGKLSGLEMGFGYCGRIPGGGSYATNPNQAGGGILAEVGVHNLDAIFHTLDANDIKLESAHGVFDHGLDIHSESRISVAYSGGRSVPLTMTVSHLVDTIEGILWRFEHANVFINIFGAPHVKISKAGSGNSYLLASESGVYPTTSDQIFHSFWCECIDAFRTGRSSSYAAASNSLVTTKAIESIYREISPNPNVHL